MSLPPIFSDTIAGIVFASILVFVWWSSYRLTSNLLVLLFENEFQNDAPDTFTSVRSTFGCRVILQILLVWASLVFVSLALGLTGFLSAWTLNAGLVVVWVLAGSIRFSGSLPISSPIPKSTRAKLKWHHWLMCFLGSLGIAQVLQMSIITLPFDWDTLAYHLPIVDSWIQTGSLWNQRCAFWYVPGNNELLLYWFSSPFSGDFWGQLNNVPVIVLLVAALIEILRMMRVDVFWQMIAAMGVISCTPVLRQIASGENDIGVGALLLASVYFLIRIVSLSPRTFDRKTLIHVVLLAISLGLLAGIKYYALGYVGVVTLLASIFFWTTQPWRFSMKMHGVLGLGLLTLGSPWYFRNWISAGSPLYPKGFRLLGIPDAWETIRPDLASTTLIFGSTVETTLELFYAWLTHGGALQLFSMLAVILISTGIAVSYMRGKGRLLSKKWWLNIMNPHATIAFASLGSLAIYLITPNALETVTGTRNMLKLQYHPVRFGFAFACISLVILTLSVQSVSRRFEKNHVWAIKIWKALFGGVALSSLIWVLLPQYGLRQSIHKTIANVWMHPSLDIPAIDWAGLTSLCFVSLIVLRDLFMWKRSAVPIALAVVFSAATPWISHHWHKTYASHYRTLMKDTISEMLDTHSTKNEPICVCEYRYYGMLGSYRQHAITRPLFARSKTDFDKFLDDGKFQFVVVLKQDNHWLREYANCLEWIQQTPSQFEQIAGSGDKLLFRRKRDEDIQQGK